MHGDLDGRRLTYVIGTYPLLTTTFIDREIRELRRLGIQIRVLAVRRPPSDTPLSADQLELQSDVTYLLPVSVAALVLAHLAFLVRRPGRYLGALVYLVTRPHPTVRARVRTLLHFGEGVHAAFLVRDDPGLELHAHFADRAATIAMVASRLLGISYSLSIHAGADIFVDPVLLRDKIARARHVATCTQHNRDHIASLVGRDLAHRITHVPHGLDPFDYEPSAGAPDGAPVILSVAQLKPRKGLDRLIRACRVLVEEGYRFECRIIGTGPQQAELAQLIRRLSLQDTVALRGALPHETVLDEYRRATLFALPCIRTQDGDVDGVPNVLAEAMAMGLPTVSSDLPAIRELACDGRTSLLVPPDDDGALVAAMRRLLDDPALRSRLGRNARTQITETFDATRNVRRFAAALWPELLDRTPSRTRTETTMAATRNHRWLAVAWAPYSRRSEMFARELDGRLACIHYLKFQSPAYAPFKYPLQAVRTLQVLFRERPAAVHVQTPPFLCGLVVLLYCRLTGARFAFEYHTAAFGAAWRWALPIQRFLARRAATNIVTNQHHAEVVRSWGGHAIVMYDPFLDLPRGKPFETADGFTVAFAGTFAEDEPIDAVVEAARLLPDVHFYVTGDRRRAPSTVTADLPPNVTLTGFLDPNGEYLGLLRAVDAVMVLTSRDHTLQLAACEAISVGTPVITTDWPYLRELFEQGAVFVDHTPESIRDGIDEARERRVELAGQIGAFRTLRRQQWSTRLARLEQLVVPADRDPDRTEGLAGAHPAPAPTEQASDTRSTA